MYICTRVYLCWSLLENKILELLNIFLSVRAQVGRISQALVCLQSGAKQEKLIAWAGGRGGGGEGEGGGRPIPPRPFLAIHALLKIVIT